MILVITDSLDPTANAVVAGFNRQGAPWARFNWAEFPERVQLDFDPDHRGVRGILDEGGDPIDLDAVANVWIWHPQSFHLTGYMNGAQAKFVAQACWCALTRMLIRGQP